MPTSDETLTAPFDQEEAADARTRWAAKLDASPCLSNELDMPFALVPPGSFVLGNATSLDEMLDRYAAFQPRSHWFEDEYPAVKRRLAKPMYVGLFPVRVADFAHFIEDSGYQTSAQRDREGGWGLDRDGAFCKHPDFDWQSVGWDYDSEHPVVNVSWFDAQSFVAWLRAVDGREYRLLTETEWEYACRGGTAGDFPCGTIDRLPDVAQLQKLPSHQGWAKEFTKPVGERQPNAFGLYDMLGNVYEWVEDYYLGQAYKMKPTIEPVCLTYHQWRSARGGSWLSDPTHCRSSHRYACEPWNYSFCLGFRVAISIGWAQ